MKKLFPGVSIADLHTQESEQIIAVQAAKTESLRERYAGKKMTFKDKTLHFSKVFLFTNALLFLDGSLCWLGWGMRKFDNNNNTRENYTTYKQAIHDAYIPTDKNGKFSPTFAWETNVLALLVVSAIVICGFKSRKDDRAAVDMMLEIEKQITQHPTGCKYNLNAKQIEKLVRVSPYVISKMSSDKRIYFDELLNGNIDIKNNKTLLAMSIAIMSGHLETHPEDIALIEQTFEKESIPDDMKRSIDCAKTILNLRGNHIR